MCVMRCPTLLLGLVLAVAHVCIVTQELVIIILVLHLLWVVHGHHAAFWEGNAWSYHHLQTRHMHIWVTFSHLADALIQCDLQGFTQQTFKRECVAP